MDLKLGTLIGALVGDAAGSTLEFYSNKITSDVVYKAMTMPGGGALNMAPGQITDDGELTLSLLSAIKNTSSYPVNEVSKAYIQWYKSNPFDMGRTCAKAFGFSGSYDEIINNSFKYNMFSEANGALMRCTPIPVIYSNLSYDKIADYAKLDAKLSHPNQVCQDANVLYCIAIAWLINNPGDSNGAINFVEDYKGICDTVKQWLEDSKKEVKNCHLNIGHVKHAFTLAFYFLRKRTNYETAIYETLLKGGDTDTNACIVGGIMGALHGLKAIPNYMKDPVINFDCSIHNPTKSLLGYKRPAIYKASNIFSIC